MKIREKIEMFSKMSVRDAEKKREEILRELDEKYRSTTAELEKSAERRRTETLAEERRRVSASQNRQAGEANLQLRRSLIELRGQLTDELFDDVRHMLSEYAAAPEYAAALSQRISQTAAKYADATFTVRPKDYETAVKAANNRPVQKGADSMLGGFIAQIPSKRMVIDESFKSKLDEERETFRGIELPE